MYYWPVSLTIREPERLVLAIDRIHDRWFDVEAITYERGHRVVKIPFWSRPANKPPMNATADSVLLVHDADEPAIADKEHIGTYTFDRVAYSNRQVVITAEPNLRISCDVGSLEIEFGPDPLDLLVAELARYPDATVTRAANSISIRPRGDGGFVVELVVDAEGYTVYFDGGWHEGFATEQEAIDCVRFGLSPSCRLAVTYRGSIACRWAVESREGADWKTESVTGLLIFPFWRRPRTVLKQNHVDTLC